MPSDSKVRCATPAYDLCVQRLYSMFPTAAPGVALLLLRVALSLLLLDGVLHPLSALESVWAVAAPWVVALALLLGFMTPIVSVASIVLDVGAGLVSGQPFNAVQLCTVIEAVALALLGPGGYSVDARLFGRRRILLAAPPDDAGSR